MSFISSSLSGVTTAACALRPALFFWLNLITMLSQSGETAEYECPLHLAVLTEVSQEIALLFPFEPVALAVLKHLLLFLEAYLLGKGKRVLVLLTLLCRAWMYPYIEIQRLLLAKMLHTVFQFSFHCPGFIDDMVAVIVIYGGLAPAEIILQPETRASVGHLSLDELRILFQFIWQSAHNELILCSWSKDSNVLGNTEIAHNIY